jgi:flagellar protein FlbB
MKSANRQRIIPLVILNILLIVIIFVVLNHFGILSFRDIFRSGKKAVTSQMSQVIVEDPFLLEREELRKQWQVLEEKERIYGEKSGEMKKNEQVLEEKLKEADNQIAIAKDMQKKQEELKKQYEDRQANVNNIAAKIGNMPPKDGVVLLEKMDPALAVDVIRRMDAIAVAAGRKSITDYLLSLMDKEKASNLIRLMSRYPQEPQDDQPNGNSSSSVPQ